MKTTKLEVKHLAPYLANEVTFVSTMDKPYNEYGKNPIWTLDGVIKMFGDYCLHTKENNDAYPIQNCHLILRPLSDLTKEIEFEGKMFVPSQNLGLILNSHNHWAFELEEINSWAIWGIMEHIEDLFKWHFDVFGLIEKGLAVDINTLKEHSL